MRSAIRRGQVDGWFLGGLALLVVAGVGAWILGMVRVSREELATRQALQAALPRDDRAPTGYVGSGACQSCHPGEHATWHRSYHRTMTQPATPQNVLGKFDGTEIDSSGLKYRVFRRGDEFWAEMPDPETLMYVTQGGRPIDRHTYWVKRSAESPIERLDIRTIPRVERRVVMTTGSHHYQTYWVPGAPEFGNLLQTLPLVYLPQESRWIPREAAFMVPPDSRRMVTQWNHHCIRCHSTGWTPGLDPQGGRVFETAAVELGISCEACHGPGERHVQANRDPRRRYQLRSGNEPDPTIVNPARLDHRAASQVCGQCHGVYRFRDEFTREFATRGNRYRPGDDLFETRYYIQHPEVEATDERRADLQRNPDFFARRWWDDGTILAGGREFTALSVTRCYTEGQISCLSCHAMHGDEPADQLRGDRQGNASCTACHQEPQYTSQVEQHTHHVVRSSGSSCLNCHMPHTSYALFAALRSHQISIPSVASSARHGVPNACNLCHLDQTLEWTQERLVAWYGHARVEIPPAYQHVSAAVRWLLAGHAAQRAIVGWHVGWEPAQQASGTRWLGPHLAPLLTDPYGVVRRIAAGALRNLPETATIHYDFLASPSQWQTTVDEVLRQASPLPAHSSSARPELLYHDDGTLDRPRVHQLLEQRDQRPVAIEE